MIPKSTYLVHNNVLLWLAILWLSILLMLPIGAITRLTESGLSIVYWKPFTGFIPPLNHSQWLQVFEAYKTSPQFLISNPHFNLSDFKTIFWWEFVHRLWGRVIGVVFVVPFSYFLLKKKLSLNLLVHLVVLLSLGGLQAFLGWWMVTSGLHDAISVSHLRLAIHLVIALLILGYLTLLIVYLKQQQSPTTIYLQYLNKPTILLLSFTLLSLMLTIVFGALNAGSKAGSLYNTWPLMNDHFVPELFYSNLPHVLNLLFNPHAIHFVHRILAYSTTLLIIASWLSVEYPKKYRLTKIKLTMRLTLLILSIQLLLGIATVVSSVHIVLAVTHQLVAALLFCLFLIAIYYRMFDSIPPYITTTNTTNKKNATNYTT